MRCSQVFAILGLVATSALDAAMRFRAQTATARPAPNRIKRVAQISSLVAKRKGKAAGAGVVPGTGPSAQMIQQQRELLEYTQQRENSGLPTFEMFVRGPNSPTWYPAGALGGDSGSKQLCDTYKDGLSAFATFAKGAIDRGVAASIYESQERKDKFIGQVLEQYPQLKKAKKELRFGYKLVYPGLLEKRPEASQITELVDGMKLSAFDSFKKGLGMGKYA
ncbi:hypothetical protein M885DRAFT_520391 [Pelagophyceae sp. CCMP2097]|nr:hypothetical protein M885DRAFT_520391 [Pelagophyceae sp. CCMP2097]|mmetsp:Transcript_3588/g.10883  ORF Transcript_3588/g.10883 Transcript_3588/m.10883 type:complete len:221 (+) Transcript_3588:46-708(+)